MKYQLLLIATVLVVGCAHQALNEPSSSAVQSGFSRVQGSATTAEAQRADIIKYNAQAQANLKRAEDKEVLINRYREYRARHPLPTPTPAP